MVEACNRAATMPKNPDEGDTTPTIKVIRQTNVDPSLSSANAHVTACRLASHRQHRQPVPPPPLPISHSPTALTADTHHADRQTVSARSSSVFSLQGWGQQDDYQEEREQPHDGQREASKRR